MKVGEFLEKVTGMKAKRLTIKFECGTYYESDVILYDDWRKREKKPFYNYDIKWIVWEGEYLLTIVLVDYD